MTYGWAAAWEFQCCGTPLRVGDMIEASPAPGEDDLAWARLLPGPVEWVVGHHDVDLASPERRRRWRITRIRSVWAPTTPIPGGIGLMADPAAARLLDTGRTAPHSGSEEAQVVPAPPGIRPGEEHWGWVLDLRPE